MASVRQEIMIEVRPEEVWDAVRDIGALHERLVPGYAVDTRLEPGARVVTFANGSVARELIVDCDDAARRLVWSIVESSALGITHHNASAQVFADGADRSRFVWVADVLPDEVAEPMGELMARGMVVAKTTLEARSLQ